MATGRLPDPNSSPLTAKGDLYTYSTVPAKLAVGNNGETLVADSSTSTGLRWVKTSPNYAVNGAFDYWQRGTSFTVGASNTYTADRFYCYAAGANATIARSTSVPTGSIAPYSLEFTGAASQTLLEIGQRIESQYMNALKTTVTFSAKVYNNTGAAFTPTIYIQTPTAADDWSGVTAVVSNVALQSCADGAWTTIYYTADWSGYSNISNGATVIIEFGAAANGASKKIRITEWQVTPTPMIIPFQRSSATLAGELAAACRYYQKLNPGTGTDYYVYGTGGGATTGVAQFLIPLPIQMRTAPSSIDYANLATYDFTTVVAPTNVTLISASTPNVAGVNANKTSTYTVGKFYQLLANNSNASYLAFNAEL